MVWIFASCVLALLVFHKGFRKFAAVTGAVAGVGGAFMVVLAIQGENDRIAKEAEQSKAWSARYASCEGQKHANDDNFAYLQCVVDVDKTPIAKN